MGSSSSMPSLHLAMAALVGASLMAISAFYLHKRSVDQVLDRLIEFQKRRTVSKNEDVEEEEEEEEQRQEVEDEGVFGSDGEVTVDGKMWGRRIGMSRSLDETVIRSYRISSSLPNVILGNDWMEDEAKFDQPMRFRGPGSSFDRLDFIPSGLPPLQTARREGEDRFVNHSGSNSRVASVSRLGTPRSQGGKAYESAGDSEDEETELGNGDDIHFGSGNVDTSADFANINDVGSNIENWSTVPFRSDSGNCIQDPNSREIKEKVVVDLCGNGTVPLIGCSSNSGGGELSAMEIGWPSNVRHVAHVTFDRFNGFLGLPDEFEPEVPRRAPSASANVFGVSTESMQLSFDARGNSVPTILLMMQRHLYAQGGLQAEGIFRINAENSQEESVRDHLNRGLVPDGVDVHCLAGLIKAWFRELPTGVLDSLSPEQVMQSQSEEECDELVRLLPPTEAALLDWAINLMADVAQLEHLNKMNARNVAMVFAPNMTQMADPLTALMYAVQVMNLLKTLIIKTLREREDSVVEPAPSSRIEPSDENGHHSSSHPIVEEAKDEGNEDEKVFASEEPAVESPTRPTQDVSTTECGAQNFLASIENLITGGNRSLVDSCPCEVVSQVNTLANGLQESGCPGSSGGVEANYCIFKPGQSSSSNLKKGSKKVNERTMIRAAGAAEKSKGTRIIRRMNSVNERVEAWR